MAQKRFEEKGAQVLSASCDSQFVQRAFGASLGGVTHPILADSHPKGKVASDYGVYNAEYGLPRRSLFIIDAEGVIRYKKVFAQGLPSVDEALAEIDKLKK